MVGWREWISLPDLGITRIKAKMDTGASSSAIHAMEVETFERDGVRMARFQVHPLQRNSSVTVDCEAEVIGERIVRSSSGHAVRRIVVRARARIGGRIARLDLTLAQRDQMGFRMLVGRRGLRRARLAVDPAGSYLSGKRILQGRRSQAQEAPE
ncbi:MAG: ATP-dependent zinc protease [Chloroflexota bacterium]